MNYPLSQSIIFLFLIFLSLECSKNQKVSSEAVKRSMDTIPQIENTGDTIPGTVSAADTVTAPFDPSNDSLVGSKQIIHWLSCNPILDSLARIYLDSFRTNDHRLQAKYQQQFKRAQDSVCRKQGLRGGYDEYEWVLKNAGNKKNKALFDSLKILIFN